jgi:hypothetical protein
MSALDDAADQVEQDDQRDAEIEQLRRALRSTQTALGAAKNKGAMLRDALQEAARDALVALGPLPPVPAPPAARGKGRPEVALMHLTDWQGAKVTPSYNKHVMHERVRLFMTKVVKIVQIHRKSHPISDAVILFGGDMIEGLFNYPAQLAQVDAMLFEQWSIVAHLIAEVVRWALSMFRTVTVVCEWGNHGRIGSKRAEVVKSDNFDRMCYEHARQMLINEPRLTWEDCPDDIQQVEVGNYRALLIHGDEIGRNGFASPMTIVRWADRQRSGAYDWEFRDLYCGHYHTHAEWPMANGKGAVYQSGSTESDNRYARDTMAASATPSQRLHFIDPVKGRVTAQYKVLLDE